MKRVILEQRQNTYKLLTRKMNLISEHQLMYDLWYEDFYRFATNRVYANVGEGFSTDDGVKWVVKNAQTEVVETPYGNRDFTPYQDEESNIFVLNEFIKGAGIIRYYDGKTYKSLKFISQAFKTPDNHPEYWEEVEQEEI